MSYIGNTSTQQLYSPTVDYFSGNGSTTAFILSRPAASVADVQVTIDNVAQNPSSAYTVSGSTITFTSAPLSGTNNIYVRYTSLVTQSIAPGQGTVTATSFVSSTGTGAGVFQTSPTITTPVISSLSSASATALTLQSAGTTAITVDTSQNVGVGITSPTAKLHVSSSTTGSVIVQKWTDSATDTGYLTTISGGGCGVGAGGFLALGSGGGASFTERMRIDSSGRVLVGLTSANTSGANFQVSQGVTFPATQSASSDANTLDDYEEGTWTPVLTASGYTFTLTGQNGVYTKIGNCVNFKIYFVSAYSTGSGNTSGLITGLPFATSNIAANYGGCSMYPDTGAAFFSRVGCIRTNAGTSSMAIGNGWSGSATVSALNWAVSGTMEWEISGHYFTT